MKLINKMEQKFGRYAVHNLTMYIIITYVAGYLLNYLAPEALSYCLLEPALILQGQVWRLVSWLLIPPGALDIFTIIMLFFYYSIGTTLEQTWGAFRYNLYIFGGIILSVIGAFVLYGILLLTGSNGILLLEGGAFSTYFISMSIFLGFAAAYPNMQVLLYFIIPLKIKWLALVDIVYLVWQMAGSGWVIFFLATRNTSRISPRQVKRRRTYMRAVNSGYNSKGQVTKHKCAVCGRTELDGDNLEFRFCSKCKGNYEYCQDHLFTHKHVQ